MTNNFRAIKSKSIYTYFPQENRQHNITHYSTSESKSPFYDALISVNLTIGDRYFFPGHNGGMNIPMPMREVTFQHDLPELDGLDNIHSPEVLK